MLLAGDVGGTKTLLGLFQRAPRRPIPVAVEAFPTNEFSTFTEMLDAFATIINTPFTVEAAAIGVAGPVVDQKASLTNVVWNVSAAEICSRFTCTRTHLLNDLEAMANSVEVLEPHEMVELQRGHVRTDGNAVVIAAGTGLGESYLHRVNGRLRPVPSEGGHADFAARTDREIDLLRTLRAKHGRVEVEHILCGPGLLNLYEFTHGGSSCQAIAGAAPGEEPAAISRAALEGSCARCVEALDLFVSAYGSEAGNLALRGVATGGVFVGGGIAPKILPLLQRGDFMDAFRAKGPMTELLSRIPVKIILNPEAGLLGAAVCANELAGGS
jgi:glucokinase